MARRVATLTRNSRTADRQGPAQSSPFRSSRPLTRVQAARDMVSKRDREIEDLEALLANATDLSKQQQYTLRLTASINNRASWLTYLGEGSPKETRAVIVP